MKLSLTVVLSVVAANAVGSPFAVVRAAEPLPRINTSDPRVLTRDHLGRALLGQLNAVLPHAGSPQAVADRLNDTLASPASWGDALAAQAMANVLAAGINPRSRFGSPREFLARNAAPDVRGQFVEVLRGSGEREDWISMQSLRETAPALTTLNNNQLSHALDALFLGESETPETRDQAQSVMSPATARAFRALAGDIPSVVRSNPSKRNVDEWLDVRSRTSEEARARELLRELFAHPTERFAYWESLRDPADVSSAQEMLWRLNPLSQLKRLLYGRFHLLR